jgi:hypothetical protein
MLSLWSAGRNRSDHGFTVPSLMDRRFKDFTSPMVIGCNFLTPFLTTYQRALDYYIENDLDMTLQDVGKDLKKSVVVAATYLSTAAVQVFIQTMLAAQLIRAGTASAGMIVKASDVYPRLHEKYIGDLLEKIKIPFLGKFIPVVDKIRIPRQVALLFGARTRDDDLAYFQKDVNASEAASDSVRRHALVTIASAVVEIGKKCIDTSDTKQRLAFVFDTLVYKAGLLTFQAAGAGLGRAVKGPVGEYWGEYIGWFAWGQVFYVLVKTAKKVEKDPKKVR